MLEAQNSLIPCVVLEMCETGFMINAVKAFSIVPSCQLEKMNIISDYIQLFDFSIICQLAKLDITKTRDVGWVDPTTGLDYNGVSRIL